MASPSEPDQKELQRGRYTLLRTLGEGAQGRTYEARDNGASAERPSPARLREDFERYVARARAGESPNPSGLVAIKSFRVGEARTWKDVELAEREARTLSALAHPRLPRYLGHFEEDGVLYLVMEKIDGESLAALRARRAVMTAAEIMTMLEQLGDALRYLHGLAPPVVHRDIKPGNIIRRPDGSFALVDFGAVRDRMKPRGGSTVVGTFGYMAPEQFQGRASARSDLYGLGATALTMLTGVEPEDQPHQGLAVDVKRAVPDGTPPGLTRALAAMLAPDPDLRVASIDEALATMRGPRPTDIPQATGRAPRHGAMPPSKRPRESKRPRGPHRRGRRAPAVVVVLAQVGLTLAILAVFFAVGLAAPLVLTILSLFFGPPLRRAARVCTSAASRATAAMTRASRQLSERRDGDVVVEEGARVRVPPVDERLRVADELPEGAPADAEHEHEEAEAEPSPRARGPAPWRGRA